VFTDVQALIKSPSLQRERKNMRKQQEVPNQEFDFLFEFQKGTITLKPIREELERRNLTKLHVAVRYGVSLAKRRLVEEGASGIVQNKHGEETQELAVFQGLSLQEVKEAAIAWARENLFRTPAL
jgi:hypothetical protein